MKRITFLVLGVFLAITAQAQNGDSPISYKSLGLQFSTQNANGDASSAAVPSVSSYNGFGSFIDNPAVMAFAKSSDISLGWFYGNNDQTNTYLGNKSSENFRKTDFGNVGMLFKYPTSQGSLVFGAGYSLTSSAKNKAFLSGRNNTSTITDMFADPSSSYNGIAFDAYAIDYGDLTETYYESIFRIGFTPAQFPGITQYVDVNRDNRQGEFSFFGATEFQKNFFAGISIGVVSGTSNYSRKFQELDEFDNYDGDFIGADVNGNGGTDIDLITLNDKIKSTVEGVNIRGGLAYKLGKLATFGASATLPSKLNITEKYSSAIKSDFDDGTATNTYDFYGELDYAITKPGQYNIGATLFPFSKLSLSASAEYIDYSKIKISLIESDISDPIEKADLIQSEQQIQSEINRDYNSVTNLKFGAVYTLSNKAKLKAGYAIYPAKSKQFNVEQNMVSAGLSIPLTDGIVFDISGQYSAWDDRSLLYSYSDPTSGNLMNSEVDQSFELLNVVAGIRISF